MCKMVELLKTRFEEGILRGIKSSKTNTWVLPSCRWFGKYSGPGVTGNILALPPHRVSLFPAPATHRPRCPKLGRRPTGARRCRLCPRASQPGTWRAQLPHPPPAGLCGCGPAAPGCGRRCARGPPRTPAGPGLQAEAGVAAGTGRALTPSLTAGSPRPRSWTSAARRWGARKCLFVDGAFDVIQIRSAVGIRSSVYSFVERRCC